MFYASSSDSSGTPNNNVHQLSIHRAANQKKRKVRDSTRRDATESERCKTGQEQLQLVEYTRLTGSTNSTTPTLTPLMPPSLPSVPPPGNSRLPCSSMMNGSSLMKATGDGTVDAAAGARKESDGETRRGIRIAMKDGQKIRIALAKRGPELL